MHNLRQQHHKHMTVAKHQYGYDMTTTSQLSFNVDRQDVENVQQ